MKKLVLLLLFIPLVSIGQNLAFIGEKSYPSSEMFVFDNKYDDLYLSFIKDNDRTMIYLVTNYIFDSNAKVNKQLTLYLDNGKVITSNSASGTDYVDKDCISIYPLTQSDISELSKNNLVRIRYIISEAYKDINRFATNTGYDIPKILNEF
tara:strand:+ start:52 stop:504 length:453 start_codon:yes stop_codon:yes gene_type:complete